MASSLTSTVRADAADAEPFGIAIDRKRPEARSRPGDIKTILAALLGTMRSREAAIAADAEPEPLHQYRVALRRMRTLVAEFDDRLPSRRAGAVRKELRWLGALTSARRDLDVQIQMFDDYRALLPRALRDGLEPVERHVRARRDAAHEALLAAMAAPRYDRLIRLVGALVDAETKGDDGEAAAHRIRRRYRRILKNGRRIDRSTPDAALHELRKSCKKLRYLIEFYRDLRPGRETAGAVRSMRRLQNCLGKFQDLAVHIEALHGFLAEMREAGTAGQETRESIEALVEALHRRQTRVRKTFAERFAAFDSPESHALFGAL